MPDFTGTEHDIQRWLVDRALPLWAEHGVDRRNGGFFEKLNFSLQPVEEPRRARLVARQIYCFAAGHEVGWKGSAKELVRHGLDFLTTRLLRDNGAVIMASSPDGATVKDQYDPYDYAFVLFSLATAARSLADRDAMLALATRIRDRLVAGWGHPVVGFEEATPRSLPLKANPHMHLLEAFLAWAELVGDRDPSWMAHAESIVGLALDRMIAPDTGALSEFFDGDWMPLADAQGLVVEPGHQFEWSWLLSRWSLLRNDRRAFDAAVKLAEVGENHGVDEKRGVAINELHANLAIRDARAKLWPQTERIKAWHVLSRHPMHTAAAREQAAARIGPAIEGLRLYLVGKPAGLWREVMHVDGSFVHEPVRASSLYHITCAIHTLSYKSDRAIAQELS